MATDPRLTAPASDAAVVTTAGGEVRGRIKDGVYLHAGIPYAAPPVGERRFLPPIPHPGWTTSLDATRFGPAAPQLPGANLTNRVPVQWDEDCLTLNVAAPVGAARDGARRPVLVWIHGGGYRSGQGAVPWYNGASFAKRGDIVTVSINYRLGALGFLELGSVDSRYAGSGLNGIRDMVAALEWVRENIAAFGGDPERVTIAGESAGAFAVSTLLALESARGLFHGAIAQSGAAHHTVTREQAARVAERFRRASGADRIEDLVSLDVDRLLQAQDSAEAEETGRGLIGTSGMTTGSFYPVVDGVDLAEAPIDLLARGLSAGVPVLTGTNRHETTLWGYGNIDDERLARVAAELPGDADALVAAYRDAAPAADAEALAVALTTDWMFRIPAVRLAEARATGAPSTAADTWLYLFEWESRAFDGRLGATHALEILFSFNTLDAPGADAFLGPGDPPRALADEMHQVWINFIRTGDPNGDVADGDEIWRPYTPDDRQVRRFGDRSRLDIDPDGTTRIIWDGRR